MKLKFELLNLLQELEEKYKNTKDDTILDDIEELKITIRDL